MLNNKIGRKPVLDVFLGPFRMREQKTMHLLRKVGKVKMENKRKGFNAKSPNKKLINPNIRFKYEINNC